MPLLLLNSYHAYECRSHVLAVFLAIVWTTFVFRPGSDPDPTRRAHNVLPRLASRLGTGTRPPILHLSRLPSPKSTYFTKWHCNWIICTAVNQSITCRTYTIVIGRCRFFSITVGIFSSLFGICCRYFKISRYRFGISLCVKAPRADPKILYRVSSQMLTEDPCLRSRRWQKLAIRCPQKRRLTGGRWWEWFSGCVEEELSAQKN